MTHEKLLQPQSAPGMRWLLLRGPAGCAPWARERSVLGLLLALSAFSCGNEPSRTDRVNSTGAVTDDLRAMVTAEGSEQFPDEGLADWVSYADGVVVATVMSEHQLSISSDVTEHREGYVGRTIEIRVDAVLWRPNANSAKLAENETKEMLVFGWLLKGDRLIPMSKANAPRLEVGGQYIIPLVEYEVGWAPLTPASVTAISNSPVATRDARDRSATNHAKELGGRTFAEIGALLSTVAPDELAKDNSDLPPEQRIQAVQRLRNPNLPHHPMNVPPPPAP